MKKKLYIDTANCTLMGYSDNEYFIVSKIGGYCLDIKHFLYYYVTTYIIIYLSVKVKFLFN